MKLKTPMELLTLFHKSDFSDTNLSVYEHKLLSVLLTFVNHDVTQGYRAWPATDLLIKRTGIKTTTLTLARKSLLREGFLLQILPNAGAGRSCVYIINAAKIVELSEKAGNKSSDRGVVTPSVIPTKPIHKRNTDGLKNQPYREPYRPEPKPPAWADTWTEDIEEPF